MAFLFFDPNPQFSDSNGVPLNSGTLTFYSPGTLTLKSTYNSSSLATANSNPITLNSAGRSPVEIWMDGSYRVILKDRSGATVWDRDNITESDSSELSIIQFGADSTGTTSVVSAVNAIAAAYPTAPVRIVVPRGTYLFSANYTTPSNITWVFRGGLFKPATGVTLTIGGSIDAYCNDKIFDNATTGLGTIALTATANTAGRYQFLEVFAEWWGALGDNSTNDSAPINAALVAAVAIRAKVQLLAKQYKANVSLPVSIGTNSNPYPNIILHGAGQSATRIISADVATPAIELAGSGTALTTNAILDIRHIGVGHSTTTNIPAIRLLGNASARLYGTIEDVWVRGNQYNNGGGYIFHIEYHLGMTMRDINSDRGHYVLYLANGSNMRAFNMHARSLSGGFLYSNMSGSSIFVGCRLEEGSVATNDTTLSAIYLLKSSNNVFIQFSNEGGNSIANTIYMEGDGTNPGQTDDASYNRFIDCDLAAPQRDDIDTSVVRIKGNCYGNSISSYVGTLASFNNAGPGVGRDIYFEANSSSQVPYSNVIDWRIWVPNASAPVVTLAAGQRGNDIRILDSRLGTYTQMHGRAFTSSSGLSSYEMNGEIFTNEGAAGAVTISMVASVAGSSARFIKMTNQVFRIDPAGTEIIRGGGAGKYLQLTNVGDSVDLYCNTAGTWEIVAQSGGITDYSDAAFDPGSLADGAGETKTVTATGVALGDLIESSSFSRDLQGITWTAYVSAADTISVRLQNETGAGPIDLASGTARFRVRKAGSPYTFEA